MADGKALRRAARPVDGSVGAWDDLLEEIGDATVVLLGEATHGSHEFYRQRALITRRLIEEKGFTGVAVEADWPDALRVNRYVRGGTDDADAEQALRGFERFPTWMWRNSDVIDFVGWLRDHNERTGAGVGFYGLDLYSLHRSIEAVVSYLETVDPKAAETARSRYACFDRFEGAGAYGWSVSKGLSGHARQGLIDQLADLVAAAPEYLAGDGPLAEDEQFHAEENARVVLAAEDYYTSMFSMPSSSWNLRDTHMAASLERLVGHIAMRDGGRTVVWAHNSHIGDARFTSMAHRGEHNLGQLARQKFGESAFLVGFTTYTGTVTAASAWDMPAERMRVRDALPGSVEAMLHEVGMPAFWVPLGHGNGAGNGLHAPRLERAIGVVYRPRTERASHYFETRLSRQFDAVVHLDRTRAVEPLEPTEIWHAGEPPETYPTAI